MNEKNKISYALSDKDVLQLVEGRARIVIYSQLSKFKTLDELLGPYGAIFLLYESRKDFGHWVAVIRRDKNTVEYFDSYGRPIDYWLSEVPENMRKVLGQDYPHLTALFYYSKYKKLEWNQYKFQKMKDGINTCGRWAALRIAFKDIPIEAFAKLFKGKNSDKIVTYLTTPDLQSK